MNSVWDTEESVALFPEVGAKGYIASSLISLGSLRLEQGDLALARSYCEEGLGIFLELGLKSDISNALDFLELN